MQFFSTSAIIRDVKRSLTKHIYAVGRGLERNVMFLKFDGKTWKVATEEGWLTPHIREANLFWFDVIPDPTAPLGKQLLYARSQDFYRYDGNIE